MVATMDGTKFYWVSISGWKLTFCSSWDLLKENCTVTLNSVHLWNSVYILNTEMTIQKCKCTQSSCEKKYAKRGYKVLEINLKQRMGQDSWWNLKKCRWNYGWLSHSLPKALQLLLKGLVRKSKSTKRGTQSVYQCEYERKRHLNSGYTRFFVSLLQSIKLAEKLL